MPKRILQGVVGLIGIACGAQGHGPEAVAVTAHDLSECVRVACAVGGEELGVAQCIGTVGCISINLLAHAVSLMRGRPTGTSVPSGVRAGASAGR